jgi:ABC-2 type transport system ATP-binding protein
MREPGDITAAPPLDDRPIAVKTTGLTKEYGGRPALEGLDLEIRRGEIFGYIGPNGAGKTTTIRILAGLLFPTRGRAEIHGVDVDREPRRIKEIVGYMPDEFGVYENMTLGEYLDFFGAAYYIPKKRRRSIIDDVLALTDLGSKRDDQVSSFSRGMKQRACLAKTLLHNPDVLILDEPASGLDPRARIEFRELLRELQRMGKTILVSSHILTELSTMCTSVGIIEKGRLVAAGGVEEILRGMRSHRVFTVRLLDRGGLESVAELLGDRPCIEGIERVEDTLRLSLDASEKEIAQIIEALVKSGHAPTEFREEKVDLETAFMTLTRGELA